MAANDGAPRLRRNGKQQSCEPCRLSKLRCDHHSPCGRCARQHKQCYFHPAPLTRKGTSAKSSFSDASASSPNLPTPASSVSNGTPVPTRKEPLPVNPLSLSGGTFLSNYRRGARYTPGFTGSTGHSAILLEHKALLDSEGWGDEKIPNLDEIALEDEKVGLEVESTDSLEATRLGALILAWLPNSRELCLKTLHKFACSCIISTPPRPLFKIFTERFWTTYANLLEGPRKQHRLTALSKELCKNTRLQIPIPKSSNEFIDSCTGSKSRWDILGSLFVMFGAAALLSSETDCLLEELVPPAMQGDKRSFGIAMLECADACLLLSNNLEMQGTSPLYLCLFLKTVCLQSVPGGDVSSSLWTRVGSLSAAITAAGLHRRVPGTGSLLYDQTLRQIFTSVFILSSTLATFHGRPPVISKYYVDIDLPFDCPEELLIEDDLAKVEETVDENGWNKAGQVYQSTTARAHYLSALIRDDILELSLGPKLSPEILKKRGADILDKMASTMAMFPGSLGTPLTKETLQTLPLYEALICAHIQLQWMHHRFLLERFDYAGKNVQLQLDAAMDMLNGCVMVWQARERFPDHHDDVHWFLTSFGIPSASYLAVDLYKSALNPNLHPPSSRRSKIIQDLSIYVIALEWIHPADGNYILCQRVVKWLKQILDRILSPPPLPPLEPDDSRTNYGNGVPMGGNIGSFPSSQEFWPSSMNGGMDLNNMSMADVPAFGGALEDWFSMDWEMMAPINGDYEIKT